MDLIKLLKMQEVMKMIDVTEYMGLAYREAKKIYPKISWKYEFQDVVQVAYLALVQAGKSFDESKGIKFSTYATPSIRGILLNFISRDKQFNEIKGVPHKYKTLSYEAEYDCGNLEGRIGVNSFEDAFITRTNLNKAIEKLDKREKQVFNLYFINDCTQKEIAKVINTSQNQVSRIKREISKKIRLAFMDCEKVTI
jgi:RNA polymerase sporulation-specific sigma factor